MAGTFNVNIEAYPEYEKIYLYFDPTEPSENDDFYEMEIDRDPIILAKLLRKLRPMKDLQTPLHGFLNFAQQALDRGVHSAYCTQDNLNSIIDAYHYRDKSPGKEFERAPEQEETQPDFITESFILREDTWIDGGIKKEGSRLTFYHGRQNG